MQVTFSWTCVKLLLINEIYVDVCERRLEHHQGAALFTRHDSVVDNRVASAGDRLPTCRR